VTTESDLRTPREVTRSTRRGSYHLPYISVRPQLATVPGENHRTVTQQSSTAPAHAADVAQAGLFTDILRAEHAELGAAAGIGARGRGASCSADQMLQLQARMKEVRQLLDALEKRFLCS
jgi:hypothetical protein